jgi:transposase
MSNTGKRYDAEFKASAVKMVKENGRSIAGTARDLGIGEQTLRSWLNNDQKIKTSDTARIMELEAQVRADKRKIADLEETVDILKKATAFFAKSDRK